MWIFLTFIAILFLIFIIISIYMKKNSRIFKLTKHDVKKEADKKYNKISDGMKQKLLRSRKKSLKTFYITFICLALLLCLASIGTILYIKDTNIILLASSIVFFGISVFCIIVLPVKLKRPQELLIKAQLKKALKKTYNELTLKKVEICKPYVKQNSDMYKNIEKLNNKYGFDRYTCRIHYYYEYLNSKRQFDNFNYDKWITQQIDNYPTFFNKLKEVYEKNSTLYQEYSRQYSKLNIYKTEIETENLNLEYETFNYIEKLLFNESKLASITEPTIILEISYTSPSGRNHYSDQHTYSFSFLLNKLEIREKQKDLILAEKLKKEKLAAEKRAKNAKLRNLEKIEKELEKKEQEINIKEKEFLDATKEHIYCAENKMITNFGIEINDTMTLTQKMKILKEKFNNGELTYDEYQKKRKEII